MNKLKLKEVTLMLETLNNRQTKSVIQLLEKDGEMTVGSVAARLRMEPARASYILSVLRKFDLVKYERDGKFTYYSINEAKTKKINFAMKNFFASTENAVFA